MANSLLPKTKSDFTSKEYWDKFFSQREKAFEWYGEYHQLSPILFKYAKTSERILVIGCGNSTVSHDLHKSGYNEVISIDVSDVVINQMVKKYPTLDFRKMDATKLEFENEEIGIVFDKGTVDALLPDRKAENVATVEKILNETTRCLRFGGRFICVSLLQQQVAKTLFDYFFRSADGITWVVRIHRCVEAENSDNDLALPVFVVVASKMKRLPLGPCILETMLSDNRSVRHASLDALLNDIQQQQNYAFFRSHLCRNTLTEEYKTELFTSEGDNSQYPKYELFVVDTPSADRPSATKFACFIVPEGRETEWLFGTPEGRKITAKQCQAFRVVFVHMSRHFSYGGLEKVQNELSAPVLQLAPKKLRDETKVPFLSIGDDSGSRTVVEIGHSSVSGDYTVEDVNVDGQIYRRLVFYGRRNLIQTEMRVQNGKVDHSYLAGEYYKYMVVALGYHKEPGNALLLGLGGGTLASFVAKYTKWKVHAVELDDEIIAIASRHFDLSNDVVTHNCDALDFIKETNERFGIIWLDIDSKDASQALSCPPEEFLSDSFFSNVRRVLTSNGVFVVNLACRDEAKCAEVFTKFKQSFPFHRKISIPDDINQILYVSPNEKSFYDDKAVHELLRRTNKDNDLVILAAEAINDVQV